MSEQYDSPKPLYALEYDPDTNTTVQHPSPTALPLDPNEIGWPNAIFGTKEDSKPYGRKNLQELFTEYGDVDAGIAFLEAKLVALKEQMSPLLSIRGEIQREIDAELKAKGMEKGKLMGYAYKYTTSTETVIEDEGIVPEEFWKQKPYIDKDLLKKTFAATQVPIPGVQILSKQNLLLKQITEK